MPPTATLEDIKAHQDRVEKDKITPDNLPPCPRCKVESELFKIHAYRERRFLIIVEMLIKAAYCSLVRFGCPGCGKTFTHYPEFAVPYKHYTQPSITGFSERYVELDEMTYQKSVMVDSSVPGYPTSDAHPGPIDGPPMDHHHRAVPPYLPDSAQPPASGGTSIKHLPGSCPLDRGPAKIQN